MTISEITGQDHEAECIWFDRLSIKRHRFNFAMLVEFRAKLTLEELVCGSYDEKEDENSSRKDAAPDTGD